MQTPRRLLRAGGRREINIARPLQKLPPRWSATHVAKTVAQFEQFRGPQVPDPLRVLAESNVAQTRELYERSKNTLQAVLESWQKSFGAVAQGAAALNRTMIDSAERNIDTGFDLATGLAGARNLAEVMELQAAYWRKVLGELRTHQGARPTVIQSPSSDAEPVAV